MAHRLAPLIALVILALAAGPVTASEPAASSGPARDVEIQADLEGVPIPAVAVGKFYCSDLEFPTIHCYKSASGLAGSLQTGQGASLLSGVDYVQIYADSGFLGASMVVSQDYPVLAVIGWNDRISSFRGKNSQTGTFYTDWFAGGSAYGFCCNQQVSSLGGFNDTFSSIYNN